jgi:hypothetical protein
MLRKDLTYKNSEKKDSKIVLSTPGAYLLSRYEQTLANRTKPGPTFQL